jgi:hypothetical protein
VQIDSAGHTFDEFRKTTNSTICHVWAGGSVVTVNPPQVFGTEVGGVDYSSPGHGLIFLYANKGITFDLAAIRRANPGRKLLRFRATAGNTEPCTKHGDYADADVRVFIDGRLHVQYLALNALAGAKPISLSLAAGDRFLTLAATDGGNGTKYDCILFGDPRLEFVEIARPGPSKGGRAKH